MSTGAPGGRLVLHTRVVSGAGGGPDKTILNSPRFLAHRGYPMLCAYLRDPSDPHFHTLETRARRWGAPLVAVDDHGPLDLGVVARLERLCREHRPAIWHGHDYKTNLLGLVVRRKQPMCLISTVHGWVKHTWKTPLYYRLDRRCLRHYDQIICVSEDLLERCLADGVPEERLWHVPNAIDTEEFCRRCPAAEAKAQAGIPRERLVLGTLGRLSTEKGFDKLIAAFGELLGRGLDLELHIAGEGDAEPALRAQIHDQRLDQRVKLLGFCDDTVALYHSMDVFVLSSIREGLPNVVLEAMALEVPVVATRVAGVPGLITDGVNGLVVAPGSVPALVEALQRLLEDPTLRARLAVAGRQTVEASYSFARRMDRMKTIYDRALDGGSERG